MLTIIHSRAEHQLRVDLDTHRSQSLDVLDHFTGAGTIDHFAAQLRLGRMHRDEKRTESLLFETVPIMIFEIRERDEVAEKKRIAIVVVFDIERIAHPQTANPAVVYGVWAVHR